MTRRRLLLPLVVALSTLPILGAPGAADHANTVPCVAEHLSPAIGGALDDAVPGVACPDLVVDGNRFNAFKSTRTFSSTHCAVQEGMVEPGTRQLLRFTFTTPNVGLADLFVGTPAANPDVFEFGACHGHFHFKDYADYRLWTPEQYASWDALRSANPGVQAHVLLDAHPELQPIRGDKRGFCVIDLIHYGGIVPKYNSCSFQGISRGWADEYHHTLDGQWIDVTGVAAGTYVLEAEVNAEHVYQESNYDNNRAARTVVI